MAHHGNYFCQRLWPKWAQSLALQPQQSRAQDTAGAIAPAGAIAAAGPDFEAAGPDFKAAGPDFEAARPDFEAAQTLAPWAPGAPNPLLWVADKFKTLPEN